MTPSIFYLHGFASGPSSSKGLFLQQKLQEVGIELQIPDFNEGGFADLTVSRQIQQVRDCLPATPVVLIGSSLGGLTAAWVAETMPQVDKLVLLAPAFQFARRWQQALGEEAMAAWKASGERAFYHYGQQRELPLKYQFVEDALAFRESDLQRQVPTVIVHGRQDEVVPVEVSRGFTGDRDWVTLHEVDSDHLLGEIDIKTAFWERIREFCLGAVGK